MKDIIALTAAVALFTGIAAGDTTQTGPNTYTADEGVTFEIQSLASSSFILSWSDDSGDFDAIDPTITLTAGQSYIFENMTTVHPFVITDDTLPVSGTDGDYVRDTTDGAVIDAATLQPIADFTADPQPADDPIDWTPVGDDAGEYYFTCRVTHHADMIGKIIIVEAPADCPADLTGEGNLDFFDISAFLGAFSSMDPIADFSKDGLFNFFDISAFLSAFSAGCP
ncbi:MAG: GC-type dockerin domain-anchored protein [Phycisphaerales bacterium]